MCDLLEKARENQGNISYYAIAKKLNTSDQRIRNWKEKRSKPNGIETLRLVEMAGLEVEEAIKLMEGGFIKLSMLILTIGFSNPITFKYLGKFFAAVQCILCQIDSVNKKAQFRAI